MSLILKWRVDGLDLFMTVLILCKYFMSCWITFPIFIPYQITSNKGHHLTHMVLCVRSMKVAAISSTRWNPQKWFSAMCVCWTTAAWQSELLWKTHFPLEIRAGPPHMLLSRILQAVVLLSSLHDEYASACFSLCLNSYSFGKHTHMSRSQKIFILLIH